MRKLVLVLALLLGLGCASSGGNALLPIHKRPHLPMAVSAPSKVFIKCGDDYYCLTEDQLNDLCVYIIEMDGLVRKYENATKVFND